MSEIRATTISDAAGTGPITLTGQSAAKAWLNMNGQGTIATRNSFNVSSLADVGTGNYTANYTSSMTSVNHAVCGNIPYATWGASVDADFYGASNSSSQMALSVIVPFSAYYDGQYIYATVHGDLA